MLIRISLIVAILAGLGVAGIAFFPLQQKIKDTQDERKKYFDSWNTETAAHKKYQKLAEDTQKSLDQTKKTLATTQQERDDAKAGQAAAEKKADELQASLKKTQQDLQAASDKLAAWESLGIQITQARVILGSLKKVTEEKEALEAEKAIIYAKAQKLQSELDEVRGKIADPELPEDLTGKVMVVDPKFDFVVLNVGQKQGVLPRGKLLVHRNGKLVAKLVVTDRIDSNQCIANVIPGYKQSDIMEGDQVFPY